MDQGKLLQRKAWSGTQATVGTRCDLQEKPRESYSAPLMKCLLCRLAAMEVILPAAHR